jgi:phosphatidate cytidylyltransferase
MKLADRISPGKTWEGVVGGLLSSSAVTLSYALLQAMSLFKIVIFVTLCLLTVVISIVGDLLESLFKRQVGLKDSSQFLPGHGGVLDRIDSLTAAAPLFVTGLILLGNLS